MHICLLRVCAGWRPSRQPAWQAAWQQHAARIPPASCLLTPAAVSADVPAAVPAVCRASTRPAAATDAAATATSAARHAVSCSSGSLLWRPQPHAGSPAQSCKSHAGPTCHGPTFWRDEHGGTAAKPCRTPCNGCRHGIPAAWICFGWS